MSIIAHYNSSEFIRSFEFWKKLIFSYIFFRLIVTRMKIEIYKGWNYADNWSSCMTSQLIIVIFAYTFTLPPWFKTDLQRFPYHNPLVKDDTNVSTS